MITLNNTAVNGYTFTLLRDGDGRRGTARSRPPTSTCSLTPSTSTIADWSTVVLGGLPHRDRAGPDRTATWRSTYSYGANPIG